MTPTKRLFVIVGVLFGVYGFAALGVLTLEWLLPWD